MSHSERRLLRSRARGSVRLRACQHYRGSEASDRVMLANLRKIGNVSFWTRQHYRGCEASDRATTANLRKIWESSFWICQHYRRSEASDRLILGNLRQIWDVNQNCDVCAFRTRGRWFLFQFSKCSYSHGVSRLGVQKHTRNPYKRACEKLRFGM